MILFATLRKKLPKNTSIHRSMSVKIVNLLTSLVVYASLLALLTTSQPILLLSSLQSSAYLPLSHLLLWFRLLSRLLFLLLQSQVVSFRSRLLESTASTIDVLVKIVASHGRLSAKLLTAILLSKSSLTVLVKTLFSAWSKLAVVVTSKISPTRVSSSGQAPLPVWLKMLLSMVHLLSSLFKISLALCALVIFFRRAPYC